MSPIDGCLKQASPDISRSRQPDGSITKNTYGSVNLSENSRAVVGNVVHQYFYGDRPSAHNPVNAVEDGGSRSVELRDNLSKIQVEAISNYDHQYAHWFRAQRRMADTCNWIMKLVKFKSWVTGTGPPVLVCVGTLGCGKSINTSAVIDWLAKPILGPRSPVISYYVDAARPHPTTASEILHALVKQIVVHYHESNMPIPRDLHDEVEAVCNPLTSATTSIVNLTAIIQHFLRLQPLCFFVIDGLDSLLEPEILIFMKFLRYIWDPQLKLGSQSKLMLSCRETLGRRIHLESIPSSIILKIKLRHLESDIHLYVSEEVDARQSESPITSDDLLVEKIKSVLKSNSEKMFLWIHLQILSLWDPGLVTCDQDIQQQLESLPEGLDEIYLRCLRRIDATNDKRSREIAPRMFKWLACAHVALTPAQAREAVSLTPDNLPLQVSQLLMSSVTDYCANLVVIDDLTGTVGFPHPSVKEFLSSPGKVPLEMSYLSLSNTESDTWCGRICLAHAKLHHTRNQLVTFRPQEIESRITTPIIKNMFRNVLPLKMRPGYFPSKGTLFQMPATAVSTRQASSVADLSLHDYICKHWLAHNIFIHESLSHYADFTDLCLAHDSELQPWSTAPFTDVEHYRRMVTHAVMTNHVPLFQVARDAISTKGRTYWEGVFQRYAPGTDSTYLHCAAVLGHKDVLRSLLSLYPGNVADAQGISAASAAMQAQQIEAFGILVPEQLDSNVIHSWPLKYLKSEKPTRHGHSARIPRKEFLLERCATCGNSEAARILLSRLPQLGGSANRIGLGITSAFATACKNGHEDMGKLLIEYGADPKIVRISGDRSFGILQISALGEALSTGNLRMMRTVLAVRHAVGTETKDIDLLDVVQHFRGDRQKIEPYLGLLLEYGVTIEKSNRYHQMPLFWLKYLIEMQDTDEQRIPPSRTRDHFIRLILQSSFSKPSCAIAAEGRNQLPRLIGHFENSAWCAWLKWTADDILAHVVNLGWIDPSFLTSPICLSIALRRGSSRFLESICGLRPIENSNAWSEHGLGYGNGTAALARMYHDGFYSHSFEEISSSSIQIREFLDCTDLPGYVFRNEGAFRAYNDCASPRRPSRLMWTRCYSKMGGNVGLTMMLCHELQRVGADGNFSLNFPAGYEREARWPSDEWTINRNIWLAVHRWNFRLNRAHGKRYSESDMWYMARVLSRKPVGQEMRSGK